MEEDADPGDVIDLTDGFCPEGHPVRPPASFCPVCLTPIGETHLVWSANDGTDRRQDPAR